ncbi:protein of unknown function [Methylocaldum szegediense]|uniref:Transposase n=1 Tax=Methylocaldum szegediense TaxID=73780 RepID=A0ABM9HWI5_9GAMM|nr:protein of unknown function [Methylocaldum szegediense]
MFPNMDGIMSWSSRGFRIEASLEWLARASLSPHGKSGKECRPAAIYRTQLHVYQTWRSDGAFKF